MKCTKCEGRTIEKKGTMPDGVDYKYLKCTSCGEETVTMSQLHEVAEKYREMKRYKVKLSKWGQSIGLRIPKELTKNYRLKGHGEVYLIPKKTGIMIAADN